MPRLEEPHWLVLLLALAFMAWYWPRPQLSRSLRFLVLGLGVLVLCRPYLPEKGDGIDLWVLMDRSASARALVEPRSDEVVALLERSKARDDRLFVLDFAETSRLRGRTDGEALTDLGDETRLASAVAFALSSMDPERNGRLLVVSDGYSTEPLTVLGERLSRENVPLDVRILGLADREDVAVRSLSVPSRGKPLEPIAIEIRLRGTTDGDVPLTLLRNGVPQANVSARIENGGAVLRFSDRLGSAGAIAYEARIETSDAVPGNNAATAYVAIDSGPRIVLLTAYASDPLADTLRAQGLQVDVVTRGALLDLGRLSGSRAVILNNVPATDIAGDVLSALDAYVRIQGGGLLMVGGRYSFGAGGYFGSAVDPLLPVSMELREEHRTLSIAMAIVMDRSGSMSIGVQGGRTKMDLANEGAARSIELLGPHDSVAVFAVDSSPHEIVPLTPLRNGASDIVNQVRRINSTGGGIYVYEGLSAAWGALERAPQGQRHVILFSDAADSEQPGDYRNLVELMVRGGATVSVIGLGSPQDADATLLQDIAYRGKGRIFFNADPATLPALFAQETVAVARSAFIEEPVGLRATAGWLEVASEPISGLTRVDSYNLSYLRRDATAAALTTDEYEAPLVALWNRGAGRVAAVSFPLGGELSDRIRGWGGYGDFAQTLGRWLMGEDVPAGIGLETKLDGTTLVFDLWFDASWQERLAARPPELFLARGTGSDVESILWERLEPGHFRAARSLRAGELYRGAVRVGGVVMPFGPVAAPGGAEWDFDGTRVASLRSLSRASGGTERTELATVWDDRVAGSRLDLRPALLWALLAGFLVEALMTRTGWRFPEIGIARFRGWGRARRSPILARTEASSERSVEEPFPGPEPVPESEPKPELDPTRKRRQRFARAKRGR